MKLWQVFAVCAMAFYFVGMLVRILHWQFGTFITGRTIQYSAYVLLAISVLIILFKKKKDR